jgi:hypothetical protein
MFSGRQTVLMGWQASTDSDRLGEGLRTTAGCSTVEGSPIRLQPSPQQVTGNRPPHGLEPLRQPWQVQAAANAPLSRFKRRERSQERHVYYRCGVLHTCHAHRSAKLAPPVRERSVHEGSRGGRRSHRNGKHRPAARGLGRSCRGRKSVRKQADRGE